MTTAKDVGELLEYQARIGAPITYQEVLNHFTDLPPFTGPWPTHPLCGIFGELDAQDHANGKPFRTSLVYSKETSIPGNGFFEMFSNYRNRHISESQKLPIWTSELNAVIEYYRGR